MNLYYTYTILQSLMNLMAVTWIFLQKIFMTLTVKKCFCTLAELAGNFFTAYVRNKKLDEFLVSVIKALQTH